MIVLGQALTTVNHNPALAQRNPPVFTIRPCIGVADPNTIDHAAKTLRAVRIAAWVFAVAMWLALAGPASAKDKGPHKDTLDLEQFIADRELWHLKPEELVERSHEKLHQGMYEAELMYANRGDNAFEFAGVPIEECVVRLHEGKLKNFYVLLHYTKDSHQAKNIKAEYSKAKAALSAICREAGRSHEFSWPSHEKIAIWEWKTHAARVRLYTNEGLPFGYVSALVERGDLPERDMEERLRVSAKHLPEKIVDGSGVCLAVPMRHQLRGIGACWSSTLCRQLAYLGSEIEPQMAAQMTAPKEEKELHRVGEKLGFHAKAFHFFNEKTACHNAVHLLFAYNDLAASHKVSRIEYKETSTQILYYEAFTKMEPHVFKAITLDKHDQEKYAEFRKVIMAYIDHSIPLSWTVTRWSSKDGKDGGRHRRMIVGYDAQRDLVFFSDPWGFNKEKEIMPLRAALTMTIWMQALYPASMHHAKLP